MKILLQPAENTDYENNISDIEEFIFNSVNNGDPVDFDQETQAYRFLLKDLNFDFPKDEEDIKEVCADIQSELDFRLKSYEEVLRDHAANSDEGDDDDGEDYSSAPASVWLDSDSLYVKF